MLSKRKAGPALAFGQHTCLFFSLFSSLKWIDSAVTLDIGVGPGGGGGGFSSQVQGCYLKYFLSNSALNL